MAENNGLAHMNRQLLLAKINVQAKSLVGEDHKWPPAAINEI